MDKEKDLTLASRDLDVTREAAEDAGPTTRMTEDYVQFLHDTYGSGEEDPEGREPDMDAFTDPDDIDELARMDGADTADGTDAGDPAPEDVLRGFTAEEDSDEEAVYADDPYFADPTDDTQEMDADTSSWDS